MAEEARIVGRQAELETLGRALAALDEGSAAMLYVVGEPGIGKTRLLAELQARAHARRHLVLAGRAAEFERDLPFGLFVAALDDYLASLTDDELAALGPDPRGRRRPSWAGSSRPSPTWPRAPPAGLQEERYRAHRAVRGLLEGLSGRRPVVLVLDDVHWADAASVELLCHLVAHRPAGPVLLALAMRPVGTSPRLVTALEQAARDGSADRLELGPLSPDDARQLIGGARRPPPLRGERGQPLLPAAAGPAGGRPPTGAGDRSPGRRLRPGRPGRAAAGAGRPGGRAGGPVGAGPHPAGGGGGVGRVLRARAGGGRRGDGRGRGPRPPRRAGAARRGATHRRAPPLPLPPPDRAPRRLRVGRARVAAHRPRPRGRGPRAAGSVAPGPGPPRRALGPGRATSRPSPCSRRRTRAAAPRAPATAARWYQAALRLLPHDQFERRLGLLVATATSLASAGLLAESRSALLDALELLPAGHGRGAGAAHRLLRRLRAPARPPPRRPRPAHGGAGRAGRPGFAGGGRPEAGAGRRRHLHLRLPRHAGVGRHRGGRRVGHRSRAPGSGRPRPARLRRVHPGRHRGGRRPPRPGRAPSSTASPTPSSPPSSTPPTTCAGPRTSWSASTTPSATPSGGSPCPRRRARATSSSP